MDTRSEAAESSNEAKQSGNIIRRKSDLKNYSVHNYFVEHVHGRAGLE